MFAKFRLSGSNSGNSPPNILHNNPILQHFDVGAQVCTAGPDLVWKVFQAKKKSNGREASVFVYEKRLCERLSRSRKKDSITELMKRSVKHLEVYRQPKLMLQLMHPAEECSETVAFASEPVLASLANILSFHVAQSSVDSSQTTVQVPAHAKEYYFIDFEIKYGLRQIAEALDFLSNLVYHHNICPSSILVTKLGNWKVAGLQFVVNVEKNDRVPCPMWTSKVPKMAQPDLDYIAPEVQTLGFCGAYSDMFSFGLLILTIFNRGKPLLQANHSSSNYLRQLELLENEVNRVLPRVPVQLQEIVVKMLSKDYKERPTVKMILNTPYFNDRYVETLQNLDVINLKDSAQKAHFYKVTLTEALPYLPRKIWFQRVWPFLQSELVSSDSLVPALIPILYLIQESSIEEYERHILKDFRKLLTSQRSVSATVVILEHLHIILDKTPKDHIKKEVLPILFRAFESNSIQIQSAALVAATNVCDYLDEEMLTKMVVPRLQYVYENNSDEGKVVLNLLRCIERILDKLEKQQIVDEILPLLCQLDLHDTDVIYRLLNVYHQMMNKKYGITVDAYAKKILPSLFPLTVHPAINLETFQRLMELVYDMIDCVRGHQRNKLKLDSISLPSPERHRPLRHLCSTDNMQAPAFNIPNLRIEKRKTSSAEDMARKNSTGSSGGWFWGATSTSDSNFLRVVNALPTRRLSDNSCMTPKICIGSSCASSPGGSPGGSIMGLPIRRHSSIGPQERRGSTIMSLSPPRGGSMPNTSGSIQSLWPQGGPGGTFNRSRRPSYLSGSQGSGSLLQQLSTGMGLFAGK